MAQHSATNVGVWLSSHLEDDGLPQKKRKPEEIIAKLRPVPSALRLSATDQRLLRDWGHAA